MIGHDFGRKSFVSFVFFGHTHPLSRHPLSVGTPRHGKHGMEHSMRQTLDVWKASSVAWKKDGQDGTRPDGVYILRGSPILPSCYLVSCP